MSWWHCHTSAKLCPQSMALWTTGTAFRRSSSWGFPVFSYVVRQIPEVCAQLPVSSHYNGHHRIDVTDVTLGTSGHWPATGQELVEPPQLCWLQPMAQRSAVMGKEKREGFVNGMKEFLSTKNIINNKLVFFFYPFIYTNTLILLLNTFEWFWNTKILKMFFWRRKSLNVH